MEFELTPAFLDMLVSRLDRLQYFRPSALSILNEIDPPYRVSWHTEEGQVYWVPNEIREGMYRKWSGGVGNTVFWDHIITKGKSPLISSPCNTRILYVTERLFHFHIIGRICMSFYTHSDGKARTSSFDLDFLRDEGVRVWVRRSGT